MRKRGPIEPGQRFGMLTIVDKTPDGDFFAECDCGDTWQGSRHALIGGARSCGCDRRARKTAERTAQKAAAEAEHAHRVAHTAWMASRHAGNAPRCFKTGCDNPRSLRGLCPDHYRAALTATPSVQPVALAA